MTKRTPEQRFWAKVEKQPQFDGCWLWTGNLVRDGYGGFWLDGHSVCAHRFSYELHTGGAIPSGYLVDHRTTCLKRCVNPSHLRLATNKQNCENRSGARKNSRSGVRGVTRSTRGNRWVARVGHNGKLIHAGRFHTIAEAEAAVIAKRLELFTHNDLDRKLVSR